jgi:hypothetical protein
MIDASTQTAAFVGWYCANHRRLWRPVVQAGSEDAALDRLLAYQPDDKIDLPVGRDPNEWEGRP